MATPEKNLSNRIRLHAGKHNILAFDVNTGGGLLANGGYMRTGLPKGFPDLMLLTNTGKIAFVEVKTKTGRLATHQRDFIDMLTKRGFIATVVWSFEDYLTLYKNELA